MIDRTLCRCTPPRHAAWPTVVAAACLTVGFALWLTLPRRGIPALGRLAAIALIATGVALAMRWLARSYTYALEQHENGTVDLTVSVCLGYRQITVCRIGLDTVTAITPQRGSKPKAPRGCYQYINAPRPESAVLLTVEDADGKSIMRITPSEEMLRLMQMLVGAGESGRA